MSSKEIARWFARITTFFVWACLGALLLMYARLPDRVYSHENSGTKLILAGLLCVDACFLMWAVESKNARWFWGCVTLLLAFVLG